MDLPAKPRVRLLGKTLLLVAFEMLEYEFRTIFGRRIEWHGQIGQIPSPFPRFRHYFLFQNPRGGMAAAGKVM